MGFVLNQAAAGSAGFQVRVKGGGTCGGQTPVNIPFQLLVNVTTTNVFYGNQPFPEHDSPFVRLRRWWR
jgi:hypothetical protein